MSDTRCATELDPVQLVSALRQSGRPAEQAAAQLYRDFWPRLFRHYLLNRVSEADAEELANQVLLKAITHIQQLAEPAALRGWLWKIAGNELNSYWRSHTMQQLETAWSSADGESLLETLPDLNTADPLLVRCLEQQLSAFVREHPERASVLELSLLEGLELAEIARSLARTPHATAEFLHQCRKRLWHYLSHCLS